MYFLDHTLSLCAGLRNFGQKLIIRDVSQSNKKKNDHGSLLFPIFTTHI